MKVVDRYGLRMINELHKEYIEKQKASTYQV
jgi:hypothetical protein